MLFKEKIFLANCDSVRRLDREALWKRIRIGLVFADGIILSPNTVIDNEQVYEALNDKQIIKYLKEEGFEKVVVRGNNIHPGQPLIDYFDNLPNNYIFSSIEGSPCKKDLSQDQLRNLINRIKKIDAFFSDVSAPREYIELTKDSLSNILVERVAGIDYLAQDTVNNLREGFSKVVSRSDAYDLIKSNQFDLPVEKLRVEIVDPSYNSLFVKPGETFVQDRIKVLDKIPNRLLQYGVTIRSLRDEIELVKFIWDVAIFVKSLGSEELIKILTDKAIDYAEDKLKEKGFEKLSRKNWFGLYQLLVKKMGVEFK